jgi:hypothetical protein
VWPFCWLHDLEKSLLQWMDLKGYVCIVPFQGAGVPFAALTLMALLSVFLPFLLASSKKLATEKKLITSRSARGGLDRFVILN